MPHDPPFIERTRNTADDANVNAPVSVGTATAVIIAAAFNNRIFFEANIDGASQGVWIRLMPANVDPTAKKGIFLPPKGLRPFEMPPDNTYTGEVSAIADTITTNVYVTEY